MSLDPATLNRRIRIDRQATGRDAYGAPRADWEPFIPLLWANVGGQSGKAAIKSGAEVGEVRASIRVRYRPDLRVGMRAVLLRMEGGKWTDERVFDVKDVMPDSERREHVDLVCLEVQ